MRFSPRFFLTFGLCFFLAACAALRNETTGIELPDTEQRAYRYLVLDNGLKVLLVSDPGADKAGASLDVNVGSRHDPEDYQGLAHFLEHMLFLGTEGYPEAGEYQAFISANGGAHNAFTSVENTNYFFDIRADALEGALDRFAQFFVSPLFNAAYVQREVNAVNSEYRARLRNDQRRELAVFKAQLNPGHPFSKFSVGNLDTLHANREEALREQLLAFYERYYSADIMALTVVGNASLDELEAMVRPRFSPVASHAVPDDRVTQPLFAPDALPRWVNIEPVQNQRSLSLQFPVPDAQPHWRGKPLSYIGNLLGHEGEGSLLSALKEKGWAEGLSAGQSLSLKGQAMFGVNIRLTEDGLANRDAVVALVFRYIELIRKEGIEPWRYAEQAQLAAQQFRFRNRPSLTQELIQLSSSLQKYPAAEVVRGDYLMNDYQPDILGDYLDAMSPEQAIITLTAPGVETAQREPLYDVPWGLRTVDKTVLAAWQQAPEADLSLPAANPFIADNFLLKVAPGEATIPQALPADSVSELWLNTNRQFVLPKGRSMVLMESALAGEDAASLAKTKMWLSMVRDQLNEVAYPAQLAGLDYGLSANWRGIEISLGGFSQKQAELLAAVLTVLKAPEWDEARFDRLKRKRMRGYENSRRQSPYQQLLADLPRMLQSERPLLDDMAAATASLSMAEVALHAEKVLKDFRYRLMLEGNFDRDEALAMAALTAEVLPEAGQSQPPEQGVANLSSGQRLIPVAAEHSDSALLAYVQAPRDGKDYRVALGLAGQMMSADFYYQLRTQKQLGYVVNAGVYPMRAVGGLFFMVQSPVADAAALQAEVNSYLERWLAGGVTEADFESHRDTLIAKLQQQPENLWEAAGRHWQDLLEGYTAFDSREQLLAALRDLSFDQWWQMMETTLEPEQRRALTVYSLGQWPDVSLVGEPVKDAAAYKAESQYYLFR